MGKVWHLSNCNTCQRIIDELGIRETFELQNIKEKNVSETDLTDMAKQAGSFEALFSRRARKFRSMGLNNVTLTEDDYKRLILEEYTFLKRPVIRVDNHYFIGNTKKVVAAAKEALTR